jgi:hypothetical protein
LSPAMRPATPSLAPFGGHSSLPSSAEKTEPFFARRHPLRRSGLAEVSLLSQMLHHLGIAEGPATSVQLNLYERYERANSNRKTCQALESQRHARREVRSGTPGAPSSLGNSPQMGTRYARSEDGILNQPEKSLLPLKWYKTDRGKHRYSVFNL